MQIHNLKNNRGIKKTTRVGRGGKRGKTSGRGHKGQKARAGNSTRPYIREDIKRIPKRRGHGKNRSRTVNSSVIKPITINLSSIDEIAKEGVVNISPKNLVKAGYIKKVRGKIPSVKILGNGDIKSKINTRYMSVSIVAKGKIEKAGGKVL